jgi:hypothetical protein
MKTEDLTFLMVGCSRCGTTWVYKALSEHPEVYLPEKKQTYFFDSHYDKGIEWYLDHFTGIEPGHRAIGEIATYYSRPDLVPLVAKHFPHARLLMSVRNPVDRAYSYYQSRASRFNWDTLEQAIDEQPVDVIERGKYIDQIETILKYYPREQLKIVFFDDLKDKPEEYLQSILDFVGVETNFKSSQIGQMVQVTLDPRIRRTLIRMGLQPLMNYVSQRPLGDKIRSFLKKSNIQRYKPISATDKQLLLEIYKPYNDRLAELTGRDLSAWNK